MAGEDPDHAATFFATENPEHQENEDLIVLIPRIVRMPEWTRDNLRALYSGTETFPSVRNGKWT